MLKRKGQTLIEVMIAAMISAMTAAAIFSVVLSGSTSGVRSDKREAAAMAIKQAQETLKMYVSEKPEEVIAASGILYAPCSVTIAPCPAANRGRWVADTSNTWALQTGVHPLNKTLLLGNTPISNASVFSYTVFPEPCGSFTCKRVVFTLNYPDDPI